MQLLGRLFDHVLQARDAHVTIVGATSGDTGSAAIEACAGRERIRIAILHPHGRTSEVQRRQMTTVQRAQRRQHRDRGHVRRLPGPGEGDVRRRAVPPGHAPLGGQLDQLGAHRRADPLLRRRRAGPRRAGPARSRSPSPPAISATCWPPGWRGAWACRSRRLIVGVQPQRHPGPLPRRQRHVDRAAWSPACRPAWTSRSAPTSSACCSNCWTATRRRPRPPILRLPRAAAAWRCRMPPGGGRATLFHGFRLDDAGNRGRDPPPARRDRLPGRPAHRDRHRRRRRAPTCRRAARHADRWRWPPRIRRSSPTRCSAPPAGRPPCRRAWPTCMTGRSASPCCPTTSAPCEAAGARPGRSNAA